MYIKEPTSKRLSLLITVIILISQVFVFDGFAQSSSSPLSHDGLALGIQDSGSAGLRPTRRPQKAKHQFNDIRPPAGINHRTAAPDR